MDMIKEYKQWCSQDGLFACGFIGCGNMAMAIVSGLINSKVFDGPEIIVSATKEESFKRWEHLNVKTTLDNDFLLSTSRIIFLCVKPHALKDVVKGLEKLRQSKANFHRQTLVSILAGISIETLKDSFQHLEGLNYIRAMPNTPLMVCAGATAVTRDEDRTSYSESNFAVIKLIFEQLGVVEIVDESKLHAITGLSGSGPAYVCIMIEALSDAGVKQGLTRDIATKFAAQTVYGAAKTILDTGLHPGQAKDQVTSAGGTTIHGIHELEKGKIRDTLMNAVQAATKRSIEMAKK